MYSASRGWKRGVGRTESPDQEMLDSGLYRTTPAWSVPGGRTGRTTRVFSAASADVGKRSAGQGEPRVRVHTHMSLEQCTLVPFRFETGGGGGGKCDANTKHCDRETQRQNPPLSSLSTHTLPIYFLHSTVSRIGVILDSSCITPSAPQNED